ncbi:ABC transporter ATP-binding protein [Natrononativus amylolyticus]|uniref:ABC transporter ATP-binding protein n=1 Tax=Natrononativus amylolyticus TaxID=2963434 RepID=UPI0020CC65B0|nr:oligopeptide/dipeptide ABC transporter ATP-binding protein [Natrononativus amylolyticus]
MSRERLKRRGRTVDDPLVEINELKTYYEEGGFFGATPVKAVDGVTLEIERGETLGLVGESGCGKTTLGRTLIQLETVTDGEILFDGTNITSLEKEDLKQWRRRTQMVFQDPNSSLNERMTVGSIIREPLDVHEWKTPRERRNRVRNLLETVGLRENHYYRYPHQFSGGQRQRIGIARALALEPEFIILDEPVSALDASVQAKILNLLTDLQDEFDLTYLFIAHDLSVVRHICDRVAVMYLGNVMEVGPTEELFQEPANPYTHSLLSAIPEPDPTVEKDRITLRGTPPSPRHPPRGCPFTTRCPMKIRPDRYRDVDDDLWTRVEMFRNILRERSYVDQSLFDRARELLGRDSRMDGVSDLREELFGDRRVDPAIAEHVDHAMSLLENGEEEDARTYLREQFGSVCDRTNPEARDIGSEGRVSHCHRHDEDYREPGAFYETIIAADD